MWFLITCEGHAHMHEDSQRQEEGTRSHRSVVKRGFDIPDESVGKTKTKTWVLWKSHAWTYLLWQLSSPTIIFNNTWIKYLRISYNVFSSSLHPTRIPSGYFLLSYLYTLNFKFSICILTHQVQFVFPKTLDNKEDNGVRSTYQGYHIEKINKQTKN